MVNITDPAGEVALSGLRIRRIWEPMTPVQADSVTTFGAGESVRRSATWQQSLIVAGGVRPKSPVYLATLFLTYNTTNGYNLPTRTDNGYYAGVVYLYSGGRNIVWGTAGGSQGQELYKSARIEAPIAVNASAGLVQTLKAKVDLIVDPLDGLTALWPESGFWGTFLRAQLQVYPIEEDPAA
jgi:hypothetical protein